MNKTVMELVQFMEQAYQDKWGYVWGAGGEVYTEAVAKRLHSIYKTAKYDATYYLTTQLKRWGGRRVADCSGLIQAFRGLDDTANGLMQKCKEVGLLRDFDGSIGRLVFCVQTGAANHVGIMVSGGYVIHSTNSERGVIKERLSTSNRGWTHYGVPLWVDYAFNRPTAKVTNKSSLNDICWLQNRLNEVTQAKLVVDGIYGAKTQIALTYYRKHLGLYREGMSGANCNKRLIKLLGAGTVTSQVERDYIGRLVKRFESGSKGSLCLDSCGNDWGLSCGSYQLTLRWGNCIKFLQKYFKAEASKLYINLSMPDKAQKAWPGKEYCSSPAEVKAVWMQCYNKVGADKFFDLEYEYIKVKYYDQAVKALKDKYGYEPDNRAMQECTWSWSVHRGVSGMLKEFAQCWGVPKSKLFETCYDIRYKSFAYPRYSTGKDSERVLLRGYLLDKAI